VAPGYLASEFLKAEGFTTIEYVAPEKRPALPMLADGEGDLVVDAVHSAITSVDAGLPILVLAGVHLGCYELFGTDSVRSIHDLKGKTVAVWALESDQHLFLADMAAYVGLDPRKDINWIVRPGKEAIQMLSEGKIDAFLGLPPEPQELRDRKIGHVVVNTSSDKPWSEHFCCMVVANRRFVTQNPVAVRRAVRAILKATDLCAHQPLRAARVVVQTGYVSREDYALQTFKSVPYDAWRTRDPDNTFRFYAVRLHEAAFIKSSPQKIISQGTDWRFLNDLKKELKA
jgi:NitT/TauT family transport system substrate-binding protein